MIDCLVQYEASGPTCRGTWTLGDVSACRQFYRDPEHPSESDLLLVRADDLWVRWVLLEHVGTPSEQVDGEWVAQAPTYEIVARGEGTGGSLRECRHTYFGPNDDERGYMFYIDPWLISWGFQCLGEFFDIGPSDYDRALEKAAALVESDLTSGLLTPNNVRRAAALIRGIKVPK